MVTLMIKTFKTKEQKNLLGKIKKALRKLCGRGSGQNGSYLTAPRNLSVSEYHLEPNYKEIWKFCTIRFNPNQRGAELIAKRHIEVAPFFLSKTISIKDMEKTILHEFLHVALRYTSNHHRFVYQVLIGDIGYDEPANVGTCSSF